VRVSAIAGYTVVPKPIIRAMQLLITQWFDTRAPVANGVATELPNTIAALLANYRR
jgi:hypothetical protein